MVLDWLTRDVEQGEVYGYGSDTESALEDAGAALPEKAYDIEVTEETYQPGSEYADAVLGLDDEPGEVVAVSLKYRHDPHFDPELAEKAERGPAPPGLHFTDEKYPPGMRYPRIGDGS